MESAKTTPPQVVHESETQRQFVRLRMPARIEVDGDQFPVRDLSPGGVGVEGVARNYGAGAELLVRLILPFDGFALDVNLTARVRHFASESKVLGLQFVDLDPDQVSVLTYVVKAYIAGDLLKVGDLLAITARENFVKVRKKKETAPVHYSTLFRARQLAGTALIALFGVAVAVFILANIYENLFLVKASDGTVTADVVTVRASRGDVYTSTLSGDALKVTTGQELGHFADGSKLLSPCDCVVLSRADQQNGYVDAGASLLRLVAENVTPYVVANIPVSEAHRLKMDGSVSFRIAGTDVQIEGKVKGIETAESPTSALAAGLPAGAFAKVRIQADQKILIDFIGRPVLVEFHL